MAQAVPSQMSATPVSATSTRDAQEASKRDVRLEVARAGALGEMGIMMRQKTKVVML